MYVLLMLDNILASLQLFNFLLLRFLCNPIDMYILLILANILASLKLFVLDYYRSCFCCLRITALHARL
jgi:hypothetical protein